MKATADSSLQKTWKGSKLQTEKLRLEAERLGDTSHAPRSMDEDEQGPHPPLDIDEPPLSFVSVVPGSPMVQRLLWVALRPEIRRVYPSAVDSYESFCAVSGYEAYPAVSEALEKWVANRPHGGPVPKQGRVTQDTMSLYLSAVRSHHINRRLSIAAFDEAQLQRFIKCIDD